MKTIKRNYVLLIAFMAVALLFVNCTTSNSSELQSKIQNLEVTLKSFKLEKALAEQRLMSFDTLDFDFYTYQKWEKFNQNHSDEILVYYPDGSTTKGLETAHIDALKPMFVFAPDTRIEKHPVSFGSGNWTAVIGEL